MGNQQSDGQPDDAAAAAASAGLCSADCLRCAVLRSAAVAAAAAPLSSSSLLSLSDAQLKASGEQKEGGEAEDAAASAAIVPSSASVPSHQPAAALITASPPQQQQQQLAPSTLPSVRLSMKESGHSSGSAVPSVTPLPSTVLSTFAAPPTLQLSPPRRASSGDSPSASAAAAPPKSRFIPRLFASGAGKKSRDGRQAGMTADSDDGKSGETEPAAASASASQAGAASSSSLPAARKGKKTSSTVVPSSSLQSVAGPQPQPGALLSASGSSASASSSALPAAVPRASEASASSLSLKLSPSSSSSQLSSPPNLPSQTPLSPPPPSQQEAAVLAVTVSGAAAAASSPLSSSSPSSPLLSPPALARSLSQSHRTSIAQYIDYERRHAQEQQYHLHKKRQHQLHTSTPEGAAELQSLSVVYLPRGGIYVHTPAGPIQLGMPPETIKDSMRLGLTLPAYFIVPKERFNLQAGINVAEFEFPAYYNFFFKRRRINLITTRAVEPLIRSIFTETLLGPARVDWPAEYGEAVPRRCYPDLMKEMSYFSVNPFDKTPLTVDSLLAFTLFDDAGRVQLPNGVCVQDAGEEFVISAEVRQADGNKASETRTRELARVRQEVFSTPLMDDATQPADAADAQPEYFVPPRFGLTMLGNSDGFDAAGTTTGFVLWMNRRGIMVDPPPYSGALLKRQGISARLMRGVILTHSHADHDAGTFQKILEEGKVVLMTTEVILSSFLRKYAAISGLDVAFLRKLFVFRPVLVGQRTAVYGGHVEFFYSLHSIPCVGFTAYCNGKSMVYSADSYNDPAGIQRLYEQGFVSEGRRDALLNFPWHHDLILHEAGVPPIHTPLSTLQSLPDDVKRRLYIVHKPSKDLPSDTGLKSALVGPQHTLVISTAPPVNHTALEVLDLLSGIDMFSGFDLSRALEILQCAAYLQFNRGDTLIAEGSYGSTLYVIAMGTVCVSQDGAVIKQLTVGDHFGEMSIVTGEARTASITALTPVEVIQFSKQEFLYIVRHTDCISRLQQLGVIQRSPSWQAISANSALSQLSSAQKTYLQSLFEHRSVPQGSCLWQAGEAATEAVLIADGKFYFSRAKEQPPFARGALVGEMRALLSGAALSTTLCCDEGGSVYAITRQQLIKFCDDNPGLQIMLMNRRFIE